jgi:hypothetical protein
MSAVEQDRIEETEQPKTITVTEAGRRYFNVCRKSAYQAVTRGEIPAIRIGHVLRVPVAALEHMMLNAGKAGPTK